MNLSEIYRLITSRTGENREEVLVKELNLAAGYVWNSTDAPGCLYTIFVRTDANSVITLPPYVWRVIGVRHATQQHITLNTPRAYYADSHQQQTSLVWQEVGRSALIRPLTGAGRLKVRFSAYNSVAIRVNISGPDTLANHTMSSMDFGTTDIQKETTKAFTDVMNITKSVITDTDAEIFDVNDTLVGLLLANQLRSDSLVIRVRDQSVVPVMTNNTTFTILYKCRPPYFREAVEDSVEDQLGLTLANYVAAELLARSKDPGDQGRARVYERRAKETISSMVTNEGEAKNEPLRIATSGHYHLYPGTL